MKIIAWSVRIFSLCSSVQSIQNTLNFVCMGWLDADFCSRFKKFLQPLMLKVLNCHKAIIYICIVIYLVKLSQSILKMEKRNYTKCSPEESSEIKIAPLEQQQDLLQW